MTHSVGGSRGDRGAGVPSSEVGASAARAIVRGARETTPTLDEDELRVRRAEQDLEGRGQDLAFRKAYGWLLLSLLVLQVLGANVLFVIYMVANRWTPDPTVVQVWLGASVVEVIGLAWVVVRSVFPPDPPPPGR